MAWGAGPLWRGLRGAVAAALIAPLIALAFCGSASAEATCGVEPAAAVAGAGKLAVTIDPASEWRPRGGDVKFTISGPDFSVATATVAACFRWAGHSDPVGNKWLASPSVRVVDATDPAKPVFVATVPPQLSPSPENLWREISRTAKGGDTEALGLVPDADFQVVVANAPGAQPIVSTQPIGITSEPLAVAVATTVVIIAWAVLYAFGKWRGVPGGNDPILQVISTKAGYASLSQLQILLWSFVIGASAIFVMVLSGNLIDITGGTLTLLGISGGAVVVSKLQSVQQSQADPKSAPLPTPPGQVQALSTSGQIEATDVGLVWGRPTTGGPIDTFTVQYRTAAQGDVPAGPWVTVTSTLADPGIRVANLQATTAYEFQVIAVNFGKADKPKHKGGIVIMTAVASNQRGEVAVEADGKILVASKPK